MKNYRVLTGLTQREDNVISVMSIHMMHNYINQVRILQLRNVDGGLQYWLLHSR